MECLGANIMVSIFPIFDFAEVEIFACGGFKSSSEVLSKKKLTPVGTQLIYDFNMSICLAMIESMKGGRHFKWDESAESAEISYF